MHYQPKSQPKPPTPMENSLAVIIAAVALVFALSFKAIAVVLKVTGKVLGFMLMSMGDDDVEEYRTGPLGVRVERTDNGWASGANHVYDEKDTF